MTAEHVLVRGPGDILYRADRCFLKVPDGKQFGRQVRRLALDSQDRMYVCQRDLHEYSLPPVTVWDKDGHYLYGWGEGLLKGLHGIFITSNDKVLLVDQDSHQVHKFTPEGELLMTLGSGAANFDAPFNFPADVAAAASGDIFVADGDGNTRVHRFAADGTHILSWGTPGRAPGQLTSPHSLCVDNRNRVLVGDRDSGRIILFTAEGEFIEEWTDVLRWPSSIYVDREDRVYVADGVCRIHTYDAEGRVLARGHAAAPPHAIYGDSRGSLYFAFPDGFPYVERWERLDSSTAAKLLSQA